MKMDLICPPKATCRRLQKLGFGQFMTALRDHSLYTWRAHAI